MLWNIFKNTPYVTVIAIIDHFIRSSRYAPMPADIAELVARSGASGKSKALGEIRLRSEAKCHDCADSGFIRLSRLPAHEPWAKYLDGSAPCHCHRGRQLIEAGRRLKEPHDFGPQYSDHWSRSYRILNPWDGFDL